MKDWTVDVLVDKFGLYNVIKFVFADPSNVVHVMNKDSKGFSRLIDAKCSTFEQVKEILETECFDGFTLAHKWIWRECNPNSHSCIVYPDFYEFVKKRCDKYNDKLKDMLEIKAHTRRYTYTVAQDLIDGGGRDFYDFIDNRCEYNYTKYNDEQYAKLKEILEIYCMEDRCLTVAGRLIDIDYADFCHFVDNRCGNFERLKQILKIKYDKGNVTIAGKLYEKYHNFMGWFCYVGKLTDFQKQEINELVGQDIFVRR